MSTETTICTCHRDGVCRCAELGNTRCTVCGTQAEHCGCGCTCATYEVTDEQIRALRAEAAEAGDLAQVALCDLALHGTATGEVAYSYAVEQHHAGNRDRILCRLGTFEHPKEEGLTIGEASPIISINPGLLYVDGDKAEARAECARVIAAAER